MLVTTENIRRWIEQSDIDYITYFIKAWIPFNAWYNSHYERLDSDREKINAIKNTSADPVRKAINAYLELEDQISANFKSHLADLHLALEQCQLESKDGKISFTEIVKEKNTKNLINNEEKRNTKYFIRREDGRRLNEITKIEIFLKDKRDGSTKFSYSHTIYDLQHLQNETNYRNLTETQKETLRLYFNELKPTITISVIENSINDREKNYYKCDSYNFKRDPQNTDCYGHIVCKGLIEILYQLRNILFHGELIPKQDIQGVYKNAYFLLKMILEKLR